MLSAWKYCSILSGLTLTYNAVQKTGRLYTKKNETNINSSSSQLVDLKKDFEFTSRMLVHGFGLALRTVNNGLDLDLICQGLGLGLA